ncbi:MAG: fused MFS/spermidine synthase, partial [Gemmatimonadales bacterium]
MGVRLVILGLFFLSGACGLVYEVVWMRMLTLVFGATAFAASTILTSFFAGLAVGAAFFGRLVDRGRPPLLVYAILEAGVGVFAFLMPALLALVTAAYVGLERQLGLGFYPMSLVRFGLSFLVLAPPAVLLGGTLPAVLKFLALSRERVGRTVALLYAVNTLGAVTGTLAAGFVLILLLGTREAAYAAGGVNLAIAAAALALHRATRAEPGHTPDEALAGRARLERPDTVTADAPSVLSARHAQLALWAVGLSGFVALAMEVFWTRALVFFLDNSTHAFTTILTGFLLGIGLGSLAVSAFVDTRQRPLGTLGVIQVLIGLSAVLAIPAINQLTPVFASMADVSVEAESLRWQWAATRFANTLTVILLPTVLMGMAFPLAMRIYTLQLGRVGTSLGNLYAVNTVGGVFGSLLAGFVIIPWIGVQMGIVLVAGLSAVVGVAIIGWEPGFSRRARVLGAAAVVGAFTVGGILYHQDGRLTLTSYYEDREAEEILFYEEGVGATVKVYRDRYGDRILSIDGFPVAGEPPEYQDAQKGLAHFPLLLTAADSPVVAIVGFGAGGTSWSVLQHTGAEVETAELVPAVPRAADLFPTVNHGVLDDPRFSLVLGDGRNRMLVSDRRYDVISVDATSPKMAGNGSLYTRDFYELLRSRTTETGIVVQWIPHHLLSDAEVRMTIRSFMVVFPHSSLWFSPLRQNMVLVGTRQPLEIDLRALRRKFENAAVVQDLAPVNIASPMDFLAGFVMGEERLADYVGDVAENTDNHPYLEFTPAMAYFVGDLFRLRNLLDFREARESVRPWL